MGEAKIKASRLHKMQQETVWCVYCGMVNAGDTIDHVPPISMFDCRLRPKGLEFLAGKDCNQATRIDEMCAALLGRMYPGEKMDLQSIEFASKGREHSQQ